MYVEPDCRGIQNNIGGQALQVIHTIQRSCHCTYTLLVANDKTPPRDAAGTTNGYNSNDTGMKLVQW